MQPLGHLGTLQDSIAQLERVHGAQARIKCRAAERAQVHGRGGASTKDEEVAATVSKF